MNVNNSVAASKQGRQFIYLYFTYRIGGQERGWVQEPEEHDKHHERRVPSECRPHGNDQTERERYGEAIGKSVLQSNKWCYLKNPTKPVIAPM